LRERERERENIRGSVLVDIARERRSMSYVDDEGANRPKLSLQPRGSTANMSSASPAKTSRVSVSFVF
jgi:hypothetical protein